MADIDADAWPHPRALTLLAGRGRSEDEAYAHLWHIAMTRQETIEAAARRIVAHREDGDD